MKRGNFSKMKKRGLLSTLVCAAVGCIVAAFSCWQLPTVKTVSAELVTTYMYMQSEELPWLASSGFRESSDNGRIYGTGTLIESLAKPTMTVWHFPKAAEVKLNTIVRKNVGNNGDAKLTFRIVHEHAASGLNEVVYPTDGGWFDLNSVEKTADGTSYVDTYIDGYVNVLPGDELKMIVNNTNNGSWCTAYLTGGIKFIYDGGPASGMSLYNNTTAIDYSISDTATELLSTELQAYYGEGATKQDAITYEYVSSYTDYVAGVPVENDFFAYYDQALVKSSLSGITGSFSGKKQLTNWLNETRTNFAGAKYIAYDVNNTLGGFVGVGAEILLKASGNSGYGGVWTPGEYQDAYLITEDGNITKTEMYATGYHNLGAVKIPDGFVGTVVFSVSSLERAAYRFGFGLDGYNSYDVPTLEKIYRFDNPVFKVSGQTYSDEGTLQFSNLRVYGNNLSDVALSANRAIQAIKNIGTVSVGSENLIAFARSTYDALDEAQKAEVFNYETLTAAEEAFACLEDLSVYVGTDGIDFAQTEGITLLEEFASSPSSFSAWIKVDRNTADGTHVGTVAGNMYKNGTGSGNVQGVYDSYASFAVEITTNGNPKFTWRVSKGKKAVFVVENVDVRTGNWLNLTFTRDAENNLLSCYVNGVLVQTMSVSEGEIADISMHRPMMIGSDLTDDFVLSVGENPVFKGSIADVKVFADPLSAQNVAMAMEGSETAGALLCSIDLRSGEAEEYYDVAGAKAVDAFSWKEVSNDYFTAAEDEFTVAVLGDTQMMFSKAKDANGANFYSSEYDETSNVFYKNVQWLIANKEQLNLQFVMHVGDITDNLNNSSATTKGVPELEAGLRWMSQLSENGIPWSLSRGNHDGGFDATYQALYDERYTYEQYGSIATGVYDTSNMRSAYYNFEVFGQKYMVVVLDIQPSDDEIAWANTLIAANPDRRVIISTHAYMSYYGEYLTSPMTGDANHLNTGDIIWEELASQHKNICMVICGHSSGTDIVKRQDKGVNGNTVWQFMIDESRLEYYGSRQTGVFALLNFSDGGDTVRFNYYSSSEGKLFRTINQFSVQLDGDEYIDSATTGVTSKNGLAAVTLPTITAFQATDGVTGNYGSIYPTETHKSDESLAMHSNNFCMKGQTYVYTVGFDVPTDGVFAYDASSYITTNASAWLYFSVYVMDGKTQETKRWFPKDGSNLISPSTGTQGEIKLGGYTYEYFLGGKSQSYSLSNMGGLRVNAGDKIIIAFRSYNTNWVKLGATITEDNGTITSYSDIQYIMNTASSTSSKALQNTRSAGWGEYNEDGTPKNYQGWTVGWFRTASSDSYAPYKYKLTVQDTDGNTLSSLPTTIQTTLPALEKTGHVFIGYNVDGALYPAGYVLDLTASKSVTAVFADFAMANGASVRLNEPAGLRFRTQILSADLEYIIACGGTVSFGTLIAMASDITDENGALDYSLLTTDTALTHLDIASTVQHSKGNGHMQFNAAVVNVKQQNLEKKFAARAYMVITYADGSQQTIYANVSNNARSVAEVAQMALEDVSAVYSNGYKNAVSGGYSPYSTENISVLNGFIPTTA